MSAAIVQTAQEMTRTSQNQREDMRRFGVSAIDLHAFLTNYLIQGCNSRSTVQLMIDKKRLMFLSP